MTNKSNQLKPIYKKQLPEGIAAAVFETTRDGRTVRSINLQKSYYRNDEWTRHTIYLDPRHLPIMIEALKATWEFLSTEPSAVTSQVNQLEESAA